MTRKNILMLSVSAGTGHTRAAEALRASAGAGDFNVSAVHLDILQFVTPWLRLLYANFYMLLVKRVPALWGYVYHATNNARPGGRAHALRRWAERLHCKRLRAEIAQRAPDIIICTHFLPAEILSRLIAGGTLNCPVWVQVTDFDLHRMWVHPHMAGYFAPNEEVAFRMRDNGIDTANIHVTGIPIMPVFSQAHARADCARELGIDPHAMTVLLMGGSAALGSVHEIAERLLGIHDKLQIIALAGKDPQNLSALQESAARFPGRLVALGYTGQIERLMTCADVVVTKPGGLTTSEALAMGLPLIVIAPIPGQEEANANYLLEQGVALQAFDLITLEYRLHYLLSHPLELAQMATRARALGRPDAAGRVLKHVLASTES